MDDGAEAAGTEQITPIAVGVNLTRKRLERLVRETREHPRQDGGPLLEGLAADMAGVAHENYGSHWRKRKCCQSAAN